MVRSYIPTAVLRPSAAPLPTSLFPPSRDELYTLLDVNKRATPAEIKRAYRTKSLQMHPDKLNQRGQEVTEQDRANFQKMKSAYDVSLILRSSFIFMLPSCLYSKPAAVVEVACRLADETDR